LILRTQLYPNAPNCKARDTWADKHAGTSVDYTAWGKANMMEMNAGPPRRPFLELKKFVVRMEGRMCSPHSRKFWVIIVGGRIGVFPIQYDAQQKSFPPLDRLYIGTYILQ